MDSNGFSIFEVSFDLGSEGEQNLGKILNSYFTMLNKIKKDGLSPELFQ